MMSPGEIAVYRSLYLSRSGLHLRDISRKVNLSMPAVLRHIAFGESAGLISSETRGRMKICRLNFSEPSIVSVIQQVELNRLGEMPNNIRSSINAFADGLEEKPLISMIFGSFARGDMRKGSDLDILLVFQRIDDSIMRNVESSASRVAGRTGVMVEPVSLGYSEFEKGMNEKGDGFIPEVSKDAIVLNGLDAYLKILGRLQ